MRVRSEVLLVEKVLEALEDLWAAFMRLSVRERETEKVERRWVGRLP